MQEGQDLDVLEIEEQTKNELTPETSLKKLDNESLALINQIVAESDLDKTKDLTYLFNINQNKKTMARLNKLNNLMDIITDQAIQRFANRPDNLSNQELFQGLKTVQDIIERGQKQITGVQEQPLIQINQQTNEVNVGTEPRSKESRDRIKSAVMSFLGQIGQQTQDSVNQQSNVIDAEIINNTEEIKNEN